MKRVPRPVRLLAPLLVCSLLPLVSHAHAHAAGRAREGLAELLGGIPAERVASGILYDRVLPLSRIAEHDGGPAAAPADLAEFRQILWELSGAAVGSRAWPDYDEVAARNRDLVARGEVPILLLDFRYDRIRPNALEDGALAVREGRLSLGASNPFDTHRVVAAAALRERTYHGERVAFRLAGGGYFTNVPDAPSGVELDFDDGRGFVPVAWEETREVRYAAPGARTIRARIVSADGTARLASFPFDVVALGTPLPDDTLHVTASIPYLGQAGAGDAYVYLADGHATITNPIVVVEGFDLDDSMDWDELYALLNREGLLETLRGDGFDAVVLNFAEATTYLQRNAFVLVELIEQVKAFAGPEKSLAVVGASMGGLVSRYALAYMEDAGIDHRVRTLVSFDSPQDGANIPLGIQYWVAFFADDAAEAGALLASLDSPASRQMLAYHHTEPPSATGTSDPLRAAFLADVAALGDYPSGPRIVSIVNGSGTQEGQGFNPGDQIVRWEYESFLVDVTGNVWAVPSGGAHEIFHGLLDFIFVPADERSVVVSGTKPYDNAPGGWRASMAQMDAVPAPFGDIVALHPSHAFIPTVSALDLDTPDLFYDVAGDPNILAITPFDAVYFPQANQEHVLITAQNAVWARAEIELGVTGVDPLASGEGSIAAILPASPNPFRDTARIRFRLPREGSARLSVHDAAGRRVAVLADGRLAAGEHLASWDGRDAEGRRLPAGVYLLSLRGPGFAGSSKLVLQ